MKLNRNPLLALAAVATVLLAGCGAVPTSGAASVQAGTVDALHHGRRPAPRPQPIPRPMPEPSAGPQAPRVFTTFDDLVVDQMLPEDDNGLKHEQFLVTINGQSVRVAHDITLAPRVPLKAGDHVRIKGVYLADVHVLHWTHYDPEGGEGGFIEFNGQVYDRLK